ncbi:hypothetical protein [Lederbergia citrea]|uniref:hypothetical protein n=1 Tax=Lederbergia citrea TaxID=2833581 RepID=UPI0020165B56|nr:hypothetical protein [Lederbergia citrea]
MFNVFEVADSLVNHIKSKCPDDIALIGYYGSRAQGTATIRSDLDFFFIPATTAGFRQSIQFVVNNISFDFWPISWERAERIAAFEELNVSIIADCKLLYVRSEGDRNRFFKLRQKITDMTHQGMELINKAESQLRDAYIHLYNMSQFGDSMDITIYRHEAQEILINVLYSISLINRTYFTKGWGKNTEQIMNFPLKPENLEQLMEKITRSSSCVEIRVACEQLTKNTVDLLLQQKEAYSDGPSYPVRMKGFYEEIKGILDKVLTASEMNDYNSAYFWAIGVQSEISRFLYFAEKGHWPTSLDSSLDYQNVYKKLGFPDLIAILDARDLSHLFEAVKRLDSLFVNHLRNQGVEIILFKNTEEFNEFLKTFK